MKIYEFKLDEHTLRFNVRELDTMWDCFVEADIRPSYEMIVAVIQSDEEVLRGMVMWHTSDTEVRDRFYRKIKAGKYDNIILPMYNLHKGKEQ